VTGEFANKKDRLSKLLTRATRDLSAVTDTPQGYRTTLQIGGCPIVYAAEQSSSTYRSAALEFYVDDSLSIISADLNYKITGYRDTVRNDQGVYDIFYDANLSGPITVTLDGYTIDLLSSFALGAVHEVALLNPLQAGWHTLKFSTSSGRGTVHPTVIIRSLQL
jgi:hypothetical protein